MAPADEYIRKVFGEATVRYGQSPPQAAHPGRAHDPLRAVVRFNLWGKSHAVRPPMCAQDAVTGVPVRPPARMDGRRRVAGSCMLAVMALCAACASWPPRGANLDAPPGFRRLDVEGEKFRHAVLVRDGRPPRASVRVYVEGDGRPWRGTDRPAADPTPANPIGLKLMQADGQSDAYLGRPCYWGLSDESPCEPIWWTHARFSAPVVRSMITALRTTLLDRYPDVQCVELVGYSGGGTLALLMAGQMSEVCAVTTVASPIDIVAWAARLGYTPLEHSENPVALPPLPARIVQRHLRGARDAVVAVDNGRDWMMGSSSAALVVIDEFDHVCCWLQRWPALLESAMDQGR